MHSTPRMMALLFACSLVFGHLTTAEVSHGLSLYGASGLKYKDGQPYAHANPDAVKGGTIKLSSYGAFTKLLPFTLKGRPAPGIGSLVFEQLVDDSVDADEPFSQYGLIAQRIALAEDRLSITYHLNPAAAFSDGHALTADDVVFSFNLIHDPGYHPFYRSYYADVERAEKVDAHTVKFHFKKYNQELPLIIGQMSILPKHIYGVEGKSLGDDFNEVAIGSGPYVVESFDFSKYITLKKNPKWWGRDLPVNKGRYNFETVRYLIYLDPIASREALKGGLVDLSQINSSKDWALEFNGDYVKKGYIAKETFAHNRVAGMQCFVFNLRRPMFQDIKVRKAISSVFDFDAANKDLFYNQYKRQLCYFDNNTEMMSRGPAQGAVKELLVALRKKHNDRKTKKVYVYKDAITVGPHIIGEAPGKPKADIAARIAAANQLLDAAGWRFDPKLKTRRRGEVTLSFRLLIAQETWVRIVNPYIENLKQIGIDASYVLVQPAEYQKKVKAFDYDTIIGNFGQSMSPGNEQRDMWTSAVADVEGSRNYIGIRNPAIDEVVEKLVEARTRKDLVTYVQVLDRILCSNHYVVPHWHVDYDRAIYWNRISGPERYAAKAGFEYNVLNWWWWDQDKATRLADAQKAGKAL